MNSHPVHDLKTRRKRLRNALWGLFAGDSLAMPAHWIYTRTTLSEVFPGGIRTYLDPPDPHPESFMFKMAYDPDLKNAARLGRSVDILHRHARFHESNYEPPGLPPTGRDYRNGRFYPDPKIRYHYHHGLKKGENTLNAHLVRVLMRSIVKNGRYNPEDFLESFIGHLTTPGNNADPYTEVALRAWFENYSRGLPPEACAASQRHVWSIGSHGGIMRPMVLSALAGNAYQGLGFALEHQQLTHRSENIAAALGILVPLFHALLSGAAPEAALSRHAGQIHLPSILGKELNRTYREYNGPKNIPGPEMWRIHTTLQEKPFDLGRLLEEKKDAEIIVELLATSCYPEHGVPLLLVFAGRFPGQAEKALLANVNAGGDNVHRGMILGLLVGAMGDGIPEHLCRGLANYEQLSKEINAFAELALDGQSL